MSAFTDPLDVLLKFVSFLLTSLFFLLAHCLIYTHSDLFPLSFLASFRATAAQAPATAASFMAAASYQIQ